MAYYFSSGANPRKPLDKKDPCPPGWDTVIEDARDRSAQFHGYKPRHLRPFIEWEGRERERLKVLKAKKEKKKRAVKK